MHPIKTVDEKLAGSLTSRTTELIPYLSYLLQDLWILGASPQEVLHLLAPLAPFKESAQFLDLACGKGAVGITLAKAFNINITGVDLMDDFIEAAREISATHKVSNFCNFIRADANEYIRECVKDNLKYDFVIFCAAGDILGNPEETLTKLKSICTENGMILIDDAYLNDNNTKIKYDNYDYLTRTQWLRLFERQGLSLIGEITSSDDLNEVSNSDDLDKINARAQELAEKYPDKRKLFEEYVESQRDEVFDLENTVTGVLWMLQRQRQACT